MALFRYSARKLSGQLVEGELNAPSKAQLSTRLAADGLVLVSARQSGVSLPMIRRDRPVRLTALTSFTREFRSMIGAGLPLAKVLSQLERRDDRTLAAAIADVRAGVEQGRSLDEAMAGQGHVFDPLYRASVRAGMATGRLEEALDRLLAYFAMRQALERKVRRAVAYPIFLLGLLAVVLAVLMLFVLPRFAELYAEFDAELPGPTQVLMRSVETAPIWIPALIVLTVGVAVGLRLWLQLPSARLSYDRLRLKGPVFGRIRHDSALVQIGVMMSMLLSAGSPLREALRFASESAGNAYLRAALTRVGDAVSRGRSLARALRDEAIFPPLSTSLLEAGEEAGDLERMFAEVAKIHEEQLEDRLSRIIALIEPAMMLLVGGVLGAVIIAVYLPIFGISSVVQ